MALIVRHKKHSAVPDGAAGGFVQPSDWNDEHEIIGEPAGGGAVTVVQGSKSLAQFETLTITHAADALKKRLVQIVRSNTSASPMIIPTMTSNNAPSGLASSKSTVLGATYAAWKAFDGDKGSFWSQATAAAGEWIAYSFAAPVAVSGYLVGRRMNADGVTVYGGYPSAYNLQYSTDSGATWLDADVRTGLNYDSPSVESKQWTLAAPITARDWRVIFTANGTFSSGYVQINRVELYGVGTTTYRIAVDTDYEITMPSDTATVVKRLGAGTEAIVASVWLP